MEQGVSVLNAQNDSLYKKHMALERLLLSVEKVKGEETKNLRVIG